jgi:AcrR family transcriptional regulator
MARTARMARRARGDATRERIFVAALARFRKQGFEATTMREIAGDAGVAVGAAYYYFPSKDAIVLAYFDETQRMTAQRVAATFDETTDVRERLGSAFHARLDVLSRDRKLLSAIFHSIADPAVDISIFGKKTKRVRDESIRLFERAIEPSPAFSALDDAAKRVLVLALWSLHMGVLLYFVHDRSKNQDKTRRLVDQALDMVCGLLPVAPELAPMFGGQVAAILSQAELL